MAEGYKTQELRDLQKALEETEHLFNKSDARLYTPNIDHIDACTFKFFDCFLMEMNVLLNEEDPTHYRQMMIERTLQDYNDTMCRRTEYYCERQELASSMVFFERMKTFLQIQLSLCPNPKNVTCD